MTQEDIEREVGWEKEFFNKFGADKIWVVPSRDNVETILELWSFIRTIAAASREEGRKEALNNLEVGSPDWLLLKNDMRAEGFAAAIEAVREGLFSGQDNYGTMSFGIHNKAETVIPVFKIKQLLDTIIPSKQQI